MNVKVVIGGIMLPMIQVDPSAQRSALIVELIVHCQENVLHVTLVITKASMVNVRDFSDQYGSIINDFRSYFFCYSFKNAFII